MFGGKMQKNAGKGFSLLKRKLKSGSIFYYRLNPKTNEGKAPSWKSTGCSDRYEAAKWVAKNILELKEAQRLTLREFLEPYYTPAGPHLLRYRQEGKSMSQRHVEDQRARMEKHIFPDSICQQSVADLHVHDFLEFRTRFLEKGVGKRTVNRCIGILKTDAGVSNNSLRRREYAGRRPNGGKPKTHHEPVLQNLFYWGSP
jgi:hypothetical protein